MNRRTHRPLLCLLALGLGANAHATDFVVTKTEDTDTSNSGTLRWALAQAASNPGLDFVKFNLPGGGGTITLNSTLNMITGDFTMIDGASQPGYAGVPKVRIDGSLLGATARGLYLRGDYIGVNALAITNFGGAGIFADQYSANGAISGCYIGVMPDGFTAAPNGDGLSIDGASFTIAPNAQGAPNVISGNGSGVVLGSNNDGSVFWGNRVGTTATGLAALPNGTGVVVNGTNITIGGEGVQHRNLISGNTLGGAVVGGSGNKVYGNWIGLSANGGALGNRDGLELRGTAAKVGSTSGGGNVISGNTRYGIAIQNSGSGNEVVANFIGTTSNGLAALPNGSDGIMIGGSNNIIGGAGAAYRNHISGNGASGLLIWGSGNQVLGNFIGLSANSTALGNAGAGIYIYGDDTTIGGPGTMRNFVSGNEGAGIFSRFNEGVRIEGNYVGLDPAGTFAIGNGGVGIGTDDAASVIDGNRVGGNEDDGISLRGGDVASLVINNRIGTNAAGTAEVANGGSGVYVSGTTAGVIIGEAGKGNQISGNFRGITLNDQTVGVVIQGNNIGLNAAQSAKLGNEETALLFGGVDHQIGGVAAGAGNVIAGNGTAMRIGNGGNHRIEGNFIGTNAAKASGLGNYVGVMNNTASESWFGGTAPGAGNVITGQTWYGIHLRGGQGNRMLGNLIYGNAGADVEIEGVAGPDSNDTLDPDQGTNAGQNFPEIASAVLSGNAMQVNGKLRSKANTEYRVEYFHADACGVTGRAQAKAYLGSENVLTDGNGTGTLIFGLVGGPTTGYIGALASDGFGNTSEFGNCVAIGPAQKGQLGFDELWTTTYEDLGYARVDIVRSLGASGAISVNFSTVNKTAIAPGDYTPVTQVVNFADGETTKQIIVPIMHDSEVEAIEEIEIRLSNPSTGVTLGLATANIRIFDHDPNLNNAAIADVTLAEPTSGQANMVFTVTLGLDTVQRTINYTTQNGTATAGVDFIATSGSITFAPGETSKTISVPVKADNLLEPDEYFNLVLSETDPNLALLRGTASGGILNTGGAMILFADGFD
jgi:hypothetical protein